MTQILFTPVSIGQLVSPESHCDGADDPFVFRPDVAAYYRKRAEGGVGLIVTEGTYIAHPSSGFDARVPHLYGDEALNGWRRVVEVEVHSAGGRIFPQLWHVGMAYDDPSGRVRPLGPSGLKKPGEQTGEPMSQAEIDAVIEGFGIAAKNAKEVGFDGLEIHAAHGYLLDQFFWEGTNRRTDRYGGDPVARTRLAVEVIEEVRSQVGADFPLVLRFSQWKLQDFNAKLATSPEELARFPAAVSLPASTSSIVRRAVSGSLNSPVKGSDPGRLDEEIDGKNRP